MRSPIVWFGGKGRMRRHIVRLLPPHRHYVEPFGGGASVLLHKLPCGGVETYNDLDDGLTSLFRVLVDDALIERFRDVVSRLPLARGMFREYRTTWKVPDDPVAKAVRWYFVARQSFGGIWGNSWGTSVSHSTGGMSSQCARWLNSIEGLPQVHHRMRRVQIEQADFRVILRRYQGPGYLAYCDPPYVMSTRRGGTYRCELTDQDHRDLVELLLAYEGAVVLSGYRSDLYLPLEDAGWQRVDIPVTCSAVGRTRATGLIGTGALGERHRRVESVWCNPETIARHGGVLPDLDIPDLSDLDADDDADPVGAA